MGWAGQVYRVQYSGGGFTYSKNVDLIDPQMMVVGSRNVNLHEGGRRKRGGTAKINTTAVTGSPQIMGGFDFGLPTSSFQVFLTNGGNLYKNPTSTIKTGMSTVNYPSFAVFDGELYICDGDTTPQTWDGAAAGTSDLTTPNSDWSGGNQPFQVITHGRGASRRTFFLYDNTAYYSALGDGKTLSGGTSGTIVIDTEDARGLSGGVEFGDRLLLFGRKNSYVVDDSDSNTANWGYAQAQWSGGAAHWRVIVKTPNDVIVMAEDGDIYSVVTAQEYGDYKQASLAHPAFVDNFIRENLDLTKINQFHGVYDSTMRAVKFFVVRSGQTEVDTSLVYFIDRPAREAWTIHDGVPGTSGYNASCSFPVRGATGASQIYTGDYDGFLWALEQATRSDGANGFHGGVKTPQLNMGDPRSQKLFKRLFVIANTEGNYNLLVNVWVDGVGRPGAMASLSGEGGALGSFVLGTDILGGEEFVNRVVALGHKGLRVQLEFYNSGASQDFFISQVLIDYKTLGARQT